MRKSLVAWIKSAVFFDILIFLLLSLLPLLWFRPGEIIVGHDNVFPLDPQVFFRDRLFAWSEHHGFGYDQSQGMGSIVIHAIDIFPSLFGIDLQTT
ncbi:MAG: hypothetical protein Q8Q49_03125, partial [bacterium]|nr:hypothetical protein [bacterium]